MKTHKSISGRDGIGRSVHIELRDSVFLLLDPEDDKTVLIDCHGDAALTDPSCRRQVFTAPVVPVVNTTKIDIATVPLPRNVPWLPATICPNT